MCAWMGQGIFCSEFSPFWLNMSYKYRAGSTMCPPTRLPCVFFTTPTCAYSVPDSGSCFYLQALLLSMLSFLYHPDTLSLTALTLIALASACTWECCCSCKQDCDHCVPPTTCPSSMKMAGSTYR